MLSGAPRATMRAILPLALLALPFAAADAAFSFHGLIGHGVAACAPVAGCSAQSLPQEQLFSLGEHHGDATVRATMRWVQSTPLAEELRLGVSYDDANGDRVHHSVQGSSPLTIDLAVPVDGELLIWGNFPQIVEGVPVWVSAQQTFQIDGALS